VAAAQEISGDDDRSVFSRISKQTGGDETAVKTAVGIGSTARNTAA
jgi:hypothetical protein